MSIYLAYWKRGWWAWLLMLLANISVGLLVVPLAIAWGDRQLMYWLSAICVWLLVGAPFWGWLFESFAKNSERIGTRSLDDGSPIAVSEQQGPHAS